MSLDSLQVIQVAEIVARVHAEKSGWSWWQFGLQVLPGLAAVISGFVAVRAITNARDMAKEQITASEEFLDKQLAASREIAQQERIVKIRKDWITSLRVLVGDVISTGQAFSASHSTNSESHEAISHARKFAANVSRLQYHLDLTESDQVDLSQKIEDYRVLCFSKQKDNKRISEIASEVAVQLAVILHMMSLEDGVKY